MPILPQKIIRASLLSTLIHLLFSMACFCATVTIPNFDLTSTSLDPTKTGFTLTGEALGDFLGSSVKRAGDVDNDGYDDILIGAHLKSNSKGEVYVIYGGPTSSFKNLDLTQISLDNASTGFKITGNADNDEFGHSVSGAGDINNDGYDDIIIGAPGKNTVYVIYGNKKSLLLDIDLGSTTLNPGTTGFTITGSGKFGHTVSRAGNVDKDDYDDIIIGAYTYAGSRGAAYVIYGRATTSFGNINVLTDLIPTSTGFTIQGKSGGDEFGFSVSTAGDINKDNYGDIIIGAFARNSHRGEVYVIYGQERSLMSDIDFSSPLTPFPLTAGFTLAGKANNDYFGWSVSTAGDVNNDGYDDIIIGQTNNRGVVYVIYGGEKSSMSDYDFGAGSTLDPSTAGFTIIGDDDNDHLGWMAASAGDVNGDGYDDIILGSDLHNKIRGISYVIYGRKTSLLGNIDLRVSDLDPETTGFTLSGNALTDGFGLVVNGAGDINGDGFDDIIIPASNKNSRQGTVYIIHAACLVAHCSTCVSRSCTVCDQGYTLSNSLCIPSTPINTKKSTLSTASSIVTGVGSVVSVGSSAFPVMNLVSEIVQNTRYMNLTVTTELSDIYKTWNTDLISWDVPDLVSRYDHFKGAPELFAQYDLGASFLSNFWSSIMTIGIGLCVFLVCFGLKFLLGTTATWFDSVLLKLIIGSLNFTLVQAYGCIDDVFFYLVLDLKTNPFGGFFSWASLFVGIGFTSLAVWLILFNVLIVKRYQRAKNDKKNLETFNEKNKYWELFYSDFDDDNEWSQSFFALLVIRSTLSSLIITTLYEYPLMQGLFLLILDGAIIVFMILKTPLKTLRAIFFQYYFDVITLIVHICTIILASQGEGLSENLRKNLSLCIIYMNTALVTGGIAYMFIEIHETIQEKINEWKLKKTKKKNNNLDVGLEENSKILSTNNMPNIKQHQRNNRPHEKITLRNHHHNSSFSGFHMQSSEGVNSSMIADNSIFPDMNERDFRMNQQRDQSRIPIHMRRNLRTLQIEPRNNY